jgi:hypothetical protein
MARKPSAWNQIRRDLYLTQRAMGDVSAASRGPLVLGKRLARRKATRSAYRLFR